MSTLTSPAFSHKAKPLTLTDTISHNLFHDTSQGSLVHPRLRHFLPLAHLLALCSASPAAFFSLGSSCLWTLSSISNLTITCSHFNNSTPGLPPPKILKFTWEESRVCCHLFFRDEPHSLGLVQCLCKFISVVKLTSFPNSGLGVLSHLKHAV